MGSSSSSAGGGGGEPADPRQSVVKAPGRVRRARLTPAPDTDPHPEPPVSHEDGGVASVGNVGRGENDDRLRRDRPPHW